jgi:large subunit ribosomal protein L29
MIKPNELRNMTVDEIRQKAEALKKELFGLRTEAREGRIEKPHRIRQARRDIARCETIIMEKTNAARNDKAQP